MASASPLSPPPLSSLNRPQIRPTSLLPFQIRQNPNPNPGRRRSTSTAASSSSSDPSAWEREEIRWLREEQRWLREEQRWQREESRWRAERESLVREIAALRLRIEALERERPVDAAVGRISEVGPRAVIAEEGEAKEMIFEEVVRVSEEKKREERKTLRMGSEGEDVRAMQEALLKLGFYSGEEDMEFSSFSSGTERAVKTWQASSGTSEDGIMTAELLERLFMEISSKDGTNGATPVTQIAEIKEMFVKETGDAEVEVSEHRVFLLGENRWEDSSRLKGKDKPISGKSKVSTPTQCLTCRGEGRLMCAECDGSGEPNIEPQFLEWVDEGAKCPYCEGMGFTTCDVCEGSGVAAI